MVPSASRVNKAGRVLRHSLLGQQVDGDDLRDARAVLLAFRAAHAQPLIKANNGLRSMLRTEGCPVEVSQRLKRESTILDKLKRQPTMALSRIQDIGGCRAIVDTLDQLRGVQHRIARNRPPTQVDDYVKQPRASGYRSVHMVVRYDERCIEIQLRTRPMHEWAVAVERLGGRIGEDLKSGKGPVAVLNWLEAVSGALEIEERGSSVDGEFMDRISRLRAQALPFLTGGPLS